jgi:hypothetical protein
MLHSVLAWCVSIAKGFGAKPPVILVELVNTEDMGAAKKSEDLGLFFARK